MIVYYWIHKRCTLHWSPRFRSSVRDRAGPRRSPPARIYLVQHYNTHLFTVQIASWLPTCVVITSLSLDKKCPTLYPLRASRQNRLKCILGTELFEKVNIDVRYYTHIQMVLV